MKLSIMDYDDDVDVSSKSFSLKECQEDHVLGLRKIYNTKIQQFTKFDECRVPPVFLTEVF